MRNLFPLFLDLHYHAFSIDEEDAMGQGFHRDGCGWLSTSILFNKEDITSYVSNDHNCTRGILNQ